MRVELQFAHVRCFAQERYPVGDAAREPAARERAVEQRAVLRRTSPRPVGAGETPGGGSAPNGRGGPSAPLRDGIGRTGGGCSQTTAPAPGTPIALVSVPAASSARHAAGRAGIRTGAER